MIVRAGKIEMQYSNGSLRWLKYGQDEVLRMIYLAVRDNNWGTVMGKIFNEKIQLYEEGFSILYDCLFEENNIKMEWKVKIDGQHNSTISFKAKGKASSTFQKNRVGICVLHPIKECAGQAVTIVHTDHRREETLFPRYISPHQPFNDVKAMEWQIGPDCTAVLEFEGEIFETEDQRNWTDNSFKTYSTPLSLPYPVTMQPGDEVSHRVVVSFKENMPAPLKAEDALNISVDYLQVFPFTSIGIGRSSERDESYQHDLKLLAEYNFHHYRVEIKLNNIDWQQHLDDAIAESQAINSALYIALFVDEHMQEQVQLFASEAVNKAEIKYIVLLPLHTNCLTTEMVTQYLPILKATIKQAIIGGGTDNFFAELNRSNLVPTELDFVSYSANPQVHAFDNATVIENAEGQAQAVLSATHKFDKPVHISPITLRIRYETAEAERHGIPNTDPRQKTIFAAGWLLASLKYIIESKAAAVTYFEAIGERGLLEVDKNGGAMWYPAATIFKLILEKKWMHALGSKSNDSSRVNSLVLTSGDETMIILVNHSSEPQCVHIDCENGRYSIQPILAKLEPSTYLVQQNKMELTLGGDDIVAAVLTK